MQDLPKTSTISVIKVNNEKELLKYRVDEMAQKLFGEDAERRFPIFLIFNKGQPKGYFHAVEQTVIYAALHPEMMSPHEFVEVSRSLITEVKRMTGNPIYMLCDKGPRASERLRRAVRLKQAKETAFIYCDYGKGAED
jgi:hypothetical protein